MTVLGDLARPVEEVMLVKSTRRQTIINELHTLKPLTAVPIHSLVVFLTEKYGGELQLWYYAVVQLFNRSLPIDTRLRDFRKQLVNNIPSIVRVGETHNEQNAEVSQRNSI